MKDFLEHLVAYLIMAVFIALVAFVLILPTRYRNETGYEISMDIDKGAMATVSFFDNTLTEPISVTAVSNQVFMLSVNGENFDSDQAEDGVYSRTIVLQSGDVIEMVKGDRVSLTISGPRPLEVQATYPYWSMIPTSGFFYLLGWTLEVAMFFIYWVLSPLMNS